VIEASSLQARLSKPWPQRLHGWHHRLLNRSMPPDEIRFVGGPRFHIDPAARYAFDFFGMHDPAMVEELRCFLDLTTSRQRFVDVGAHWGLFSLVFASRPGAMAYAVEPSPTALEVLEHHRAANPDFDLRIKAAAIGASPGEINVELGDHGMALHPRGSVGSLTVPMLSLDVLLEQEEFPVDTLKVDVEGMEVDVLEGAANTLRDSGPITFLEIHPPEIQDAGRRVGELQSLFEDAGYTIRDTKGDEVSDLEDYCGGYAVRRIVARR
jgi:FkbM family methyltransferase